MRWFCARHVPHPENCSWWSGILGQRHYVAVVSGLRDLRDMKRSFDSLWRTTLWRRWADTGSGTCSGLATWSAAITSTRSDSPVSCRFIHASEEHGKNSVPEIVLRYALGTTRFNGTPPRWAVPCRSTSTLHHCGRCAAGLPRTEFLRA